MNTDNQDAPEVEKKLAPGSSQHLLNHLEHLVEQKSSLIAQYRKGFSWAYFAFAVIGFVTALSAITYVAMHRLQSVLVIDGNWAKERMTSWADALASPSTAIMIFLGVAIALLALNALDALFHRRSHPRRVEKLQKEIEVLKEKLAERMLQ